MNVSTNFNNAINNVHHMSSLSKSVNISKSITSLSGDNPPRSPTSSAADHYSTGLKNSNKNTTNNISRSNEGKNNDEYQLMCQIYSYLRVSKANKIIDEMIYYLPTLEWLITMIGALESSVVKSGFGLTPHSMLM